MLLITCPICGIEADETEFAYGGQAGVRRPMSHEPEAVGDGALVGYLYNRDNVRGVASELWLCARGCGKWFEARRDTVTLEFKSCRPIGGAKPARRRRARPRKAPPKAGGEG